MMFDSIPIPFLSCGLLSMLLGAVLCWPKFQGPRSRQRAVAFLGLSLVMFLAALIKLHCQSDKIYLDPLLPFLETDAVDGLPLVVFHLVAIIAVCIAPRRDVTHRSLSGIFLLAMGTTLIYTAANLWVLNAGWWLTCVPFFLAMFGDSPDRKHTNIALISSAIMLTLSTVFLHATQISSLSTISHLSLLFFLMAVVMRKGLFPLHAWTLRAFECGPLLPKSLLFNSHLGALLVARAQSAGMPAFAQEAMYWLSLLALATALITSLRGLIERKPRRLMGLVCISQASFILAGLLATNTSGVMGGMLHWMVVALASTGLIGVVRILEVRVLDVADPTSHLGLAVRTPRLATFFILAGLALVGLPGTMGYCAEDLLFHGVQDHHPVMGVSLLLATAVNAINLMRLYSILFLGVLPKNVIEIPDAMPRERWPLVVLVLLLIGGGLFPSIPISLRATAMKSFHLITTDDVNH
jgi:NADH-quinone oxidoreductase subunit M